MSIPKGWKSQKLEEVSIGIIDCHHSTPIWTDSGFIVLRTHNIKDGSINFSSVSFTDEINYKERIKRAIPEKDDIVLTREAPAGEVALIPDNLKVCLGQRLVLIKLNNNFVSSSFVKFYLMSNLVQRNVFQLQANGSTVGNIRIPVLKGINLFLPPLREQCRIAEILGVWDESIDLLEKLTTSKHKLKQGLMQQLLIGKKRFKEFKASIWQPKILIEIAEVLVSPVDKLIVDGENSIYLCNYTDVYKNNRITQSINFMQATATEKEIAKFMLRKDDVIITKDSESPTDIAVPAYVSESLDNVICGYHLAILRPRENEVCGEYLSYLLSTPEIRYYFFTLANGATRFGLSVGSIEKAQFSLPSLPEQEKIAAVLSAADAEISTLEKQLAAYKQQKRGLMQQLLTGRTRILGLEDGQD
jgi:type I restriction enzyme, S subunit